MQQRNLPDGGNKLSMCGGISSRSETQYGLWLGRSKFCAQYCSTATIWL